MNQDLASLCEELGVSVVSITKHRDSGETCAGGTLARILEEHGPAHLRSVLLSIMETGNNKDYLVAPVIWAVSDIILAHPDWFGGAWLDAMDAIDLAEMHERARANRRAAQPRQAIATMLFERLSEIFQERARAV